MNSEVRSSTASPQFHCAEGQCESGGLIAYARSLESINADMLAALQLVAHDVRSGSLPTNIQNAITAAIAKATGEAPR